MYLVGGPANGVTDEAPPLKPVNCNDSTLAWAGMAGSPVDEKYAARIRADRGMENNDE
jgi:hypothetical protein